ncbi:MAG: BrnA antitoxin family protein [Rhizobacter sp.]|nr:BrnA antitoxin family protein [Bacteriovorax sp.]
MKQPKLSDLTLNIEGTKRIREMAAKSKKIKITINIDEDTIELIKSMAAKTGGSYQKTLNELLKTGLEKNNDAELRLQKIEKEIAKIKKKLAA